MAEGATDGIPLVVAAGPLPRGAERAARWFELNRAAQLGVHHAADATVLLYADHPDVRAELATLVAAEAAEVAEVDLDAYAGDGHLVLLVRPAARAR